MEKQGTVMVIRELIHGSLKGSDYVKLWESASYPAMRKANEKSMAVSRLVLLSNRFDILNLPKEEIISPTDLTY